VAQISSHHRDPLSQAICGAYLVAVHKIRSLAACHFCDYEKLDYSTLSVRIEKRCLDAKRKHGFALHHNKGDYGHGATPA
jgi:NAD(P)H-nitrite reductase large subunit